MVQASALSPSPNPSMHSSHVQNPPLLYNCSYLCGKHRSELQLCSDTLRRKDALKNLCMETDKYLTVDLSSGLAGALREKS